MRRRATFLAVALVAAACGTSGDDAPPGDGPGTDGAPNDGAGGPGPDGSTDGGAGTDAPGDGTITAKDAGGGDGDGDGADDGAAVDSAVPCGTDPWVTYAHDARRSSATDACISGTPSFQWRYAPAPPAGKTVKGVFNAIAQSDAAFVAWSSQNDPYLGTSAVDRVVAAGGTRAWTYNSNTDTTMGNWPSLAAGAVLVNDDGLYFLDPANGTVVHNPGGVDNWGQTAPSAAGVYAVNTSHVDGAQIYVGAYDATGAQTWAQNKYGTCRIDAADSLGGFAVDGGVLYYAPKYAPGTGVTLPFASGVFAFDAATGAPRWFKATTPASAPSAGGGKVYLAESGNLVARNQADGSVAWQKPVSNIGAQAPVLAGGLAIVGTSAGVSTFDATTGNPGWSAAMTGVAVSAPTVSFSGGCAGANVAQASKPGTTLAAALGSGSLVVTAADGVHVLKLADGSQLYKGTIAQASGALRNPALVGHRLYAIDNGALVAVDWN